MYRFNANILLPKITPLPLPATPFLKKVYTVVNSNINFILYWQLIIAYYTKSYFFPHTLKLNFAPKESANQLIIKHVITALKNTPDSIEVSHLINVLIVTKLMCALWNHFIIHNLIIQ